MSLQTLSVGEVLWDMFPNYKKPGGSPANVAYHLHCLGTTSLLLSRVGTDVMGQELLSFLNDKGIHWGLIQEDPSQPTGIVNIKFIDGEPSYTINEPSAWDFVEITDELNKELDSLDAICFASLSQRNNISRETVQTLLKSVPESCLKVFDLNLRPPFVDQEVTLQCIQKADVIKVNEHEFEILTEWYDSERFIQEILEKNPSKIFLLTEGKRGSSMFTTDKIYHEDAYPITGEGDFVGVGDAFLACFTYLKLLGTPDSRILSLTNRYAAYVASKKGGMPEIPQSILDQIH